MILLAATPGGTTGTEGAMSNLYRNSVLTWIVLVAYLASTAVAGGAILCREPDGRTVIELTGGHEQCAPAVTNTGCGNEQGGDHADGCLTSCGDCCPCEDTPLGSEPARVTKKVPQPIPADDIAVLPCCMPDVSPSWHGRVTIHATDRSCPAMTGTLRIVRTVVLRL